ncbi:MAG: HflX GTPase family protein [Christensenellales bacterium]
MASRKNARKKRLANEMKTVAFVGYTNAGKSSSINTLIHMFQGDKKKEVFVKNMLFATLETATRRIKLPTNEEFIITDTVGFVSNLPHHLIESFKSTLEEVKEASLIVHVVDASSPYANLQIQTTNQVLTSLGVKDIPMVYLLNKYDLVKNDMFMPTIIGDQIRTSNLDQRGFDELIAYIKDKLFDDVVKVKLLIPYDKGEIFNLLKRKVKCACVFYIMMMVL